MLKAVTTLQDGNEWKSNGLSEDKNHAGSSSVCITDGWFGKATNEYKLHPEYNMTIALDVTGMATTLPTGFNLCSVIRGHTQGIPLQLAQ